MEIVEWIKGCRDSQSQTDGQVTKGTTCVGALVVERGAVGCYI